MNANVSAAFLIYLSLSFHPVSVEKEVGRGLRSIAHLCITVVAVLLKTQFGLVASFGDRKREQMFGLIIRNYKNAGVRVNVTLCVQRTPEDKDFSPVFVHGASGLKIHNLAATAHRHLLQQARNSSLPKPAGERFEDVAWKVATYSLIQALPQLLVTPASQVANAIPYACFIAEHLSKVFHEGEERDVCISSEGLVFINTIAGMHTDTKTLGNYKA